MTGCLKYQPGFVILSMTLAIFCSPSWQLISQEKSLPPTDSCSKKNIWEKPVSNRAEPDTSRYERFPTSNRSIQPLGESVISDFRWTRTPGQSNHFPYIGDTSTSNTVQHVLYGKIIPFFFAKSVIQEQNTTSLRHRTEKPHSQLRERDQSIWRAEKSIPVIHSCINEITAVFAMKDKPEVSVFRDKNQWRLAAQNAYVRHGLPHHEQET